jgi:hypothetical protein
MQGHRLIAPAIKGKAWILLLTRLLDEEAPEPFSHDAMQARMVRALASGHYYKDKDGDGLYVMLRTNRPEYPWLVIHATITFTEVDGESKEEGMVTLGSEHAQTTDAPFMLINRSGEWFVVLDEITNGKDPNPLFTTHKSARSMIKDSDTLYTYSDNYPDVGFTLIPDTITPPYVHTFFQRKAQSVGTLLSFKKLGHLTASGLTRKGAARHLPPATLLGVHPATSPKISLARALHLSIQQANWNPRRLMVHSREDEKHLERMREASVEELMNPSSLEALRQYLKKHDDLIDEIIIPALYTKNNGGVFNNEQMAQFIIPIYPQREVAAPRAKHDSRAKPHLFELHGLPLGFILGSFRPDAIARGEMRFTTFYNREMMQKEIDRNAALYRGTGHGDRFNRVMHTPLEKITAALLGTGTELPRVWRPRDGRF